MGQSKIRQQSGQLPQNDKTFSQIREEDWQRRIAAGEQRYMRLNLGTRKSGMIGVAAGSRLQPKHGRKAKLGQPLGGRSGRFYKAR